MRNFTYSVKFTCNKTHLADGKCDCDAHTIPIPFQVELGHCTDLAGVAADGIKLIQVGALKTFKQASKDLYLWEYSFILLSLSTHYRTT